MGLVSVCGGGADRGWQQKGVGSGVRGRSVWKPCTQQWNECARSRAEVDQDLTRGLCLFNKRFEGSATRWGVHDRTWRVPREWGVEEACVLVHIRVTVGSCTSRRIARQEGEKDDNVCASLWE
jgi:hypothetical protein